MSYDVRIAQVPRHDLAVVRRSTTFTEIPSVMASAFGAVAAYLAPRGLLGTGPALGRYTEMDMTTGTVTVAAGFVVEEPIDGDGTVVPDETPASDVATATHVGPYANIAAAYDAIAAFAAEQGRELDQSTMWEEYWSPPGTPDEQTRTEVFCPLRSSG